MFAGVVGKSAQFPLHTWLPDAMAGPTPVSALIHAATMVAAGVYVMARDFVPTISTAWIVTVVGSITLLLGALAACVENDLKRVLAWSTVSQLGYMVAAWQLGGFVGPALFHLIAHAAFKALLFLAAGALSYVVGTNAIDRMGGLRRVMPLTFVAMTVGLASLAAVPPFAGFWSKESILGAAADVVGGGASGIADGRAWVLLVAGFAGVPLTAFYATRVWLRVFFGQARDPNLVPERAVDRRSVPVSMQATLIGLIIPALLVGAGVVWLGWLHPNWFTVSGLGQSIGELAPQWTSSLLGVAATVLGCLTSWVIWRRGPLADPADLFGRLRPLWASGLYLDPVQRVVIVRPVSMLATLAQRLDVGVIDGAVIGLARLVDAVSQRAVAVQRGLTRYLTIAITGVVVATILTAVLVAWTGGGAW